MKRSIQLSFFLGSLLVCFQFSVKAQMMPLDPAVRTGKLANGFSYFIRKNTEPKGRAFLYLAVKAGSILEDENQRGLAHFLEHMNFNGTKHFPKNELVNYLEKAGVKFGADLNAYTSYDETVYQLPIPTDDTALFRNSLLIMRDWAQDALLDSLEIEKERGVVIEEKRLQKGVYERIGMQTLPVLLNHSRYFDRQPIGTEEVLKNFKPEAIKKFHSEWYRPELQALVVVGDIDVNAVEKEIKNLFADLKNPTQKRLRDEYKIPFNGKNQFIRVSDKELTEIGVEVLIKRPFQPIKTQADYRRSVVKNLFNQMLSARHSELLQEIDPPFIGIGGGFANQGNLIDGYSINFIPKPGKVEKAFQIAFAETERVKRFGFTSTELDRAKNFLQSRMNSMVKEKNKIQSSSYVREYVKYFLTGEAVPGIVYEHKFLTQALKNISLKDIDALIADYLVDGNRDISITGPDDVKDQLPGENEVASWFSAAKNEKLSAYVDNVSHAPLLSSKLNPGKVIAEKSIPGIGVIELTLNNGVKVILKPTDFKNDEILIRAYSPGGTSLYDDPDYASASSGAGLVNSFGIGEFDAIQLPKKLTGKRVRVGTFIGELIEGVNGSSVPDDLETALQLVYLYFTKPRKDEKQFNNYTEKAKVILANRYKDPDNVFHDTVSYILGNYKMRRSGPSIDRINQINLDRAYEIYKQRFADASDFTFVFVGNFDQKTIRPLLEKYLGALPSINRKEKARDLDMQIPAGRLTKKVYKGSEDKANIQLTFSGPFEYSQENNLLLKAMTDILRIKLIQRLREKEGGTYSPSTGQVSFKYPKKRFAMSVQFECSPDSVDKLIKATQEEISGLQEQDDTTDVAKFIAEEGRDIEKRVQTNNFWAAWLIDKYQNEENPAFINQYKDALKKITPAMLRAFAKKYLSGDNLKTFILLPENKVATNSFP